MAQVLFILARAVHFAACLLALGAFAMDVFIVTPAIKDSLAARSAWRAILKWLLLIALPLALLSGAAWLVFVAMEMSDLPFSEAIKPDVLRLVWSQTQFGHVWQVRAVLWTATVLLAIAACMRPNRTAAPAFAMSMLLAGSLAWSGHGQTGGPYWFHLSFDIVHIVAGGFWPAGLVPLAMLLLAFRKFSSDVQLSFLPRLIARFSAMSLIAVALLVVSGLANSWFLLGPWRNLYRMQYGIYLLAKVTVFGLMLVLGARNLLKWKPVMSRRENQETVERAVRRMRLNVLGETVFGAAVLVLVGGLGIAPPPAMDMPHAHHHDVSIGTSDGVPSQSLAAPLAGRVGVRQW